MAVNIQRTRTIFSAEVVAETSFFPSASAYGPALAMLQFRSVKARAKVLHRWVKESRDMSKLQKTRAVEAIRL